MNTAIRGRKAVKKVTIKNFIDDCPNHFTGRKGNIPDIIVLHNTGGNKISSAHWWFLDKESLTSAHFLVGLDGEIRQYVNIADGAYCNGTSINKNKNSYYKNATNPIVKSRSANANYYTVSIECVGDCGDRLTEAQMDSVVELVNHIKEQIRKVYGKVIRFDRNNLIGHFEICPKSKSTCGVNIQYDEILDRLDFKPPIVEPVKPPKPVEEPKKRTQTGSGFFNKARTKNQIE